MFHGLYDFENQQFACHAAGIHYPKRNIKRMDFSLLK